MELNRFEKSPNYQKIPNILERYMVYVAKTGSSNFPWTKIKPLFRAKLESVIMDFSNVSPAEEIPAAPNVDVFSFVSIRGKVFEQLDAFAGIPFTVQRLAELLTAPRRHYKRTDKFMRALEKNMLIVSTVEARAENNNGEDLPRTSYLMNGEYLSNGNLSKDTNGNKGPGQGDDELAKSEPPPPPPLAQRDNIEDELTAELTSPEPGLVTDTPPVAAVILPPEAAEAEAIIEDEIVGGDEPTPPLESTPPPSDDKTPDQSSESSANTAQKSEVETTESRKATNEIVSMEVVSEPAESSVESSDELNAAAEVTPTFEEMSPPKNISSSEDANSSSGEAESSTTQPHKQPEQESRELEAENQVDTVTTNEMTVEDTPQTSSAETHESSDVLPPPLDSTSE